MKKLTTIVAALLLLISVSTFATDVNVSSKIKSSFKKDFTSYSNERWTIKEDAYIVSFKQNDQDLAAAYNEDGDLLSVSRTITLSQLPLSVSMALQNKYSGYAITDSVIELSAEGTSYFINAENAKYKVRMQADTAGGLNVINKTKKK